VDTETAQQLVTLLKSLNEEDRVTIVVVTHDLDVAKETKRQIRLKDGKVVADEAVTPIAVA
jgi:putative ABC transport system ATP-binding protein